MARILLTEPDRAIREFIAGILSEFGHDVVASENIVDAEVWLATSPIDVLVTDLVLRGEQGVMLSRSCSELGIPTVTLSGGDFLPGQVSRPRRCSKSRSGFPICSVSCTPSRRHNRQRPFTVRESAPPDHLGAQWPARYLPCFA
jgi:CheY-like chemotaxis protein